MGLGDTTAIVLLILLLTSRANSTDLEPEIVSSVLLFNTASGCAFRLMTPVAISHSSTRRFWTYCSRPHDRTVAKLIPSADQASTRIKMHTIFPTACPLKGGESVFPTENVDRSPHIADFEADTSRLPASYDSNFAALLGYWNIARSSRDDKILY
jgi:hypothetical protein